MVKWLDPNDYIYLKDNKIINYKGLVISECFSFDSEWELWEPKGNNFAWACEQLLKGEKVRRKSWDEQYYICIPKGGSHTVSFLGNYFKFAVYLNKEYMEATDWILYKE